MKYMEMEETRREEDRKKEMENKIEKVQRGVQAWSKMVESSCRQDWDHDTFLKEYQEFLDSKKRVFDVEAIVKENKPFNIDLI